MLCVVCERSRRGAHPGAASPSPGRPLLGCLCLHQARWWPAAQHLPQGPAAPCCAVVAVAVGASSVPTDTRCCERQAKQQQQQQSTTRTHLISLSRSLLAVVLSSGSMGCSGGCCRPPRNFSRRGIVMAAAAGCGCAGCCVCCFSGEVLRSTRTSRRSKGESSGGCRRPTEGSGCAAACVRHWQLITIATC